VEHGGGGGENEGWVAVLRGYGYRGRLWNMVVVVGRMRAG
jgi:hypothetical protein